MNKKEYWESAERVAKSVEGTDYEQYASSINSYVIMYPPQEKP